MDGGGGSSSGGGSKPPSPNGNYTPSPFPPRASYLFYLKRTNRRRNDDDHTPTRAFAFGDEEAMPMPKKAIIAGDEHGVNHLVYILEG